MIPNNLHKTEDGYLLRKVSEPEMKFKEEDFFSFFLKP